MKVKVISIDNKEVEEINLAKSVFGADIREDLVSKLIRWQLAKRRSGNHHVKERNEINGSNAKIYRQKGTGRARHGSKKVVQFRGGGAVHAPRKRTHNIKIQNKVKKQAMRSILSSKYKEGSIVVIDEFKLKNIKTSELVKKLTSIGIKSAVMIDGKKIEKNFYLSSRNIKHIKVIPMQGTNAFDILRNENLVFSREGIKSLEKILL